MQGSVKILMELRAGCSKRPETSHIRPIRDKKNIITSLYVLFHSKIER